mmetsp:Transcript_75906/g.180403  ORF Transcript_75906/g.180403 Transcript_75906/m.180403 type:complete len:588 (-) Transcript_75906:56-1819(-)
MAKLQADEEVEVWTLAAKSWVPARVVKVAEAPGEVALEGEPVERGREVRLKTGGRFVVTGSVLVSYSSGDEKQQKLWIVAQDIPRCVRRIPPREHHHHHGQQDHATKLLEQASPPHGCLQELRQRFSDADSDASGALSLDEVARLWRKNMEQEIGRTLTDVERELLAARVAQSFQAMDLDHNSEVRLEEWLHHSLLSLHPPGAGLQEQMNSELRKERGLLAKLVASWSRMDTIGVGHCHLDAAVAAVQRASGASAEEAQRLLSDAQLDGTTRSVYYSEFIAACLGLVSAEVTLLWYDISEQWAKYISPVLLWRHEEGIWHTGIVAFGKEYYYGGYIYQDEPGETPFGKPTKSIKLGQTLRKQEELEAYIVDELDAEFTPENYDVLSHNCNNFTEKASRFLLGRHIPDMVRKQPERVLHTPLARMMRPLLNKFLGNIDGEKVATQKKTRGLNKGAHGEPAQALPVMPERTLADAARQLVGENHLVLYEPPEQAGHAVVATVTKKHLRGFYDISWYGDDGELRTATHVWPKDVEEYKPEGRIEEDRQLILAALLQPSGDDSSTAELRKTFARHFNRPGHESAEDKAGHA